jgi:hypothetical protein
VRRRRRRCRPAPGPSARRCRSPSPSGPRPPSGRPPDRSRSPSTVSQATYTLDQQPGGIYYYFGKQPVGATYLPAGPFTKSAGSATFTVAKPVYTALPDGVEIATAVPGSGPAIGTGQTASAFYTEYLAKNGKAVDYSVKDGDTTFPYTLGAGDVITGFDEGTVGMQVGETRVLLIPPAEGYGSTTNGAIPKNSTLLFVVTLESIS